VSATPSSLVHVALIVRRTARAGFGFAAASTFGPVLAAWLYAAAGDDSVWYACGGLGVLLAAGFASLRAPIVAQSTPATTVVEEGSAA